MGRDYSISVTNADSEEYIFNIECDIQNGFKSHEFLCRLSNYMLYMKSDSVTIDYQGVKFIAANLMAVMGCVFQEYTKKDAEHRKVQFINLKKNIFDAMRRNGFGVHLDARTIPDRYNTVIPYQIFNIEAIELYEKYLTINLFGKDDIPDTLLAVSDSIKDYLLELFKNVKDHTTSNYVYTCGQYFPKTHKLYFTIADAGETIPYNVSKYHRERNLDMPLKPILWALTSGNTTSDCHSPRGIGLALIKEFIEINQGEIFIVSGDESFELTSRGEVYRKFGNKFNGTFVTLGFNLAEDKINNILLESSEDIVF